MRHFFGWSKDSDMPSRYVHLSGKDYEENMLRRAGKLDASRMTPTPLQPRVCQCGHENPTTRDYCEIVACGRPLTPMAARRREQDAAERVMAQLLEDPAALEKLGDLILAKATCMAERARRSVA
jgi:hypothetical protein